jgi:hypothetical protein
LPEGFYDMTDVTFHEIHSEFVVCGEDYRLERGPRRVMANATKEVLSNDVTAAHYRLPEPIKDAKGQVVKGKSGKPILSYALDADGQPIKEGEEFTYLDYGQDRAQMPWYVFVRHPREVFVNDPVTGRVIHDEDNTPLTQIREDNFEQVGCFDTREEAEAFVREQIGDPKARRKKASKRPIPIRLTPEDRDPPLEDLIDQETVQ